MSTKPRNKQLRITMFLNTPTPTNSRKQDRNPPMTRKRRRELEAELEAGNDSSGVDSVEVETPVHAGKRARRPSKATPKPTPPPGKGKSRFQQRDESSDEEGKRAGSSGPPMHRAVRTTRKAGNLFTPECEGARKSDPPEDRGLSSLKTPLAELKLGDRFASTESPLPRTTRKGPRSSDVGLPTPIATASKSKANNPSKGSVKPAQLEPPDNEPIIISSSPLSPLTDLPGTLDSPPRPRSPHQGSSPIFKVPPLPLQTPRRDRAENRRPGLIPLHHSATAVDSDEWVVPTSQSQDLRPFVISPPRPGGSVLFKDTTPKLLRQSQGYMSQPSQPLPSVLATIQLRGQTESQESDIVVTSQIQEAELRLPRSAQAGQSRALAFSSPSPKRDNPAANNNGPPSSERTGIFRTPTKVTGLPLDGKANVMSPISGSLYSPERNSPTRRNDDGPSTSLPPSSFPPSTNPNPHKSSRDDAALDFVQYQTTPTKPRYSIDSPRKELKLFESQMTHSPTWSQPRSFERWRLRDLLDSQRAFGEGKAGLEAEAEGREPGEGLGTTDGEESGEMEKAAMMASSLTEPESQDPLEFLLRNNPELKYAGKAPPCESSSSSLRSSKSGSDSAKQNEKESGSGNRTEQVGIIVIDDTPAPSQDSKRSDNSDPITNRIGNVGMMPSTGTQSSLTESESYSGGSRNVQDHDESQGGGLGESDLVFSQPTLDPLMGFLDIFEGTSIPLDSQSVIDIDD